ncbi:MAG: GIY-YIG nuclease family protein [Oscillospiraceae bacterium]|jgi:hypothetical protein|nr:GIY-YIG nuclease family protein [Oscillospiraceae bacterium]
MPTVNETLNLMHEQCPEQMHIVHNIQQEFDDTLSVRAKGKALWFCSGEQEYFKIALNVGNSKNLGLFIPWRTIPSRRIIEQHFYAIKGLHGLSCSGNSFFCLPLNWIPDDEAFAQTLQMLRWYISAVDQAKDEPKQTPVVDSPAQPSTENAGYVYILTSKKCDYIKIGRTVFPPAKRIREINATNPYAQFAPWELSAFLEVTDCAAVETQMHRFFQEDFVSTIPYQSELFAVPFHKANKRLMETEEPIIISKQKIDRLCNNDAFLEYLIMLFKTSGLFNHLNDQGIWTFTIYPMTENRYFTLNIGSHEVAFSRMTQSKEKTAHMLFLDELVCDDKDFVRWLYKHGGHIGKNPYTTSGDRGLQVLFYGDFSFAREILRWKIVQTALIAYWTTRLLQLHRIGALSAYARHHNYNAVARLYQESLPILNLNEG